MIPISRISLHIPCIVIYLLANPPKPIESEEPGLLGGNAGVSAVVSSGETTELSIASTPNGDWISRAEELHKLTRLHLALPSDEFTSEKIRQLASVLGTRQPLHDLRVELRPGTGQVPPRPLSLHDIATLSPLGANGNIEFSPVLITDPPSQRDQIKAESLKIVCILIQPLQNLLDFVSAKRLDITVIAGPRSFSGEDIRAIGENPNLEELALVAAGRHEESAVDISGLAAAQNLRRLSLTGLIVDSADFSSMNGLEQLSLENVTLATGGLLQVLGNCPNLRKLTIDHCNVGGLGLTGIRPTEVTEVGLDQVVLRDVDLRLIDIFSESPARLVVELTDDWLETVAGERAGRRFATSQLLKSLSAIENLDSVRIKLDSGGVSVDDLKSLLCCPNLRELSVRGSLLDVTAGAVTDVESATTRPFDTLMLELSPGLHPRTLHGLRVGGSKSLLLTSRESLPADETEDWRLLSASDRGPVDLTLVDFSITRGGDYPLNLLSVETASLRIKLGVLDPAGIRQVLTRTPVLRTLELDSVIIRERSAVFRAIESSSINELRFFAVDGSFADVLDTEIGTIRVGSPWFFER